ncbi:alpha/beta hydrolase, partial [Acidiferrimicrobium sp. IK]|uniref:alpha/beta fold hydrolase n=1 Tax=Acidiferrimicrobium sp. IK TaxID=2871700 RepID=UPI0021CB046B
SMEAMADDLADICEQVGEAPVVVGASMGGLVALSCEGLHYPGLLRGVVLVDITPKLESKGVNRIVSFMQAAPAGFASLEEAADAIAAYRPDRPRTDNLDGLRKNLRLGEDGRWRWHWDPAFLGNKVGSRISEPDQLERAAASLRVPTLLVRGRMSDLVSQEGVEAFRRQCPQASYVDVAGAGHMVVGDRNDVFADAVIDWLDKTAA